jgi:hypothetical protein
VTHVLLDRADLAGGDRDTGRLVVTIRRPDGDYQAVGLLSARSGRYTFAYLRQAAERPDFVPLLGFPERARVYERPYLFPLFAERVISPRRPDRPQYLSTLNLSEDATPLEVLTRSGGHRPGDSIELVPMPTIHDGPTHALFMVHGIRYRELVVSERISHMSQGDPLSLVPEPTNVHDPLAVGVHDTDGLLLGYVPRPLTGYIHALISASVQVEVANGPEVNPHLRLLVRLDGVLPRGVDPFTGPEWETLGRLC